MTLSQPTTGGLLLLLLLLLALHFFHYFAASRACIIHVARAACIPAHYCILFSLHRPVSHSSFCTIKLVAAIISSLILLFPSHTQRQGRIDFHNYYTTRATSGSNLPAIIVDASLIAHLRNATNITSLGQYHQVIESIISRPDANHHLSTIIYLYRSCLSSRETRAPKTSLPSLRTILRRRFVQDGKARGRAWRSYRTRLRNWYIS